MLTDYMVVCPFEQCHWSGSLFPQGSRDAWRAAMPTHRQIVFQCPRCHGEWHAQIVGDDAIPMPLHEAVSQA